MANIYYYKSKEAILLKLKERYQSDQKFREKAKKTYRERYQTDKKYKETTLKRANDRYKTDIEYRRKTIERSKLRLLKLKEMKLDSKNDSNVLK